jgi:ribosomal protein S18 acetylase RimI-like enzyme
MLAIHNADPRDIDRLARFWFDGWQDAHAHLLPSELRRLRTLESFEERLRSYIPQTRVADVQGKLAGFCITKHDELYQLYVDAWARGSGAAAALLADAEARMMALGVTSAWLSCAIGNERAMRFYEKSGWRCAGPVTIQTETAQGPFELEVLRYEKQLQEERRIQPRRIPAE